MMKPCCGLMGKLCGHKFESFIIKYDPTNSPFNGSGNLLTEALDKLSEKTYFIRCKRCGALPEYKETE